MCSTNKFALPCCCSGSFIRTGTTEGCSWRTKTTFSGFTLVNTHRFRFMAVTNAPPKSRVCPNLVLSWQLWDLTVHQLAVAGGCRLALLYWLKTLQVAALCLRVSEAPRSSRSREITAELRAHTGSVYPTTTAVNRVKSWCWQQFHFEVVWLFTSTLLQFYFYHGSGH